MPKLTSFSGGAMADDRGYGKSGPSSRTKPRGRPDPADMEGTTRGAERAPASKMAPKTSPRPRPKPKSY